MRKKTRREISESLERFAIAVIRAGAAHEAKIIDIRSRRGASMSGKIKPPGCRLMDAETGERVWKLYSRDHLSKTVIGQRFPELHYQTIADYIRKRERKEKAPDA